MWASCLIIWSMKNRKSLQIKGSSGDYGHFLSVSCKLALHRGKQTQYQKSRWTQRTELSRQLAAGPRWLMGFASQCQQCESFIKLSPWNTSFEEWLLAMYTSGVVSLLFLWIFEGRKGIKNMNVHYVISSITVTSLVYQRRMFVNPSQWTFETKGSNNAGD